jgi:acetyl-CoA carboxylase biotin carboxylase subunit
LAAGYTNAGTVEFLLDASGEFYFLEVNKRLQVEHLVTELTTGVDIVEAQLSVALNSNLDFSQNEVKVNGWAINCRVNAEDPQREFAPSPGTIVRYLPPSGPGVRVDSALYSGYTIPEYYDSMVAKVATYGRNRDEAIRRMRCALDEIEIAGVPTTVPLHRGLMQDSRFLDGRFDTTYLDEFLPLLKAKLLDLEKIAVAAAGAAKLLRPTVAQRKLPSTEQSNWREHGRMQLMNSGRGVGW